jgi:pimeloyl-ACP methyl ester carboxylesterase
MWADMEAIAPSLAHDDEVMGDGLVPRERLREVTVPVLALAGARSPAWLREAARAVAEAAPQGTYRALENQNHMVEPQVLGLVLAEFFAG